jgi:hypothetical protein
VNEAPPAAVDAAAVQQHDDVPDGFARAHRWVLDHWPTSLRQRLAVTAVLIAIALVAIAGIARLVGTTAEIGLLAYVGVMVVCWVGAGGALVPVPGTRPLSWVLIVQQSTVVDPLIVALTAACAMALGQTSFFVATRLESRRHGAPGGHHLHLPGHATQSEAPGTRPTPNPNPAVTWSRKLLAKGKAGVEARMTGHPQRIVFLLCILPNPLTTFATVSAAATGVPFSRFFGASLAGFLVLCLTLVIMGQGLLVLLGIA